MKVAPNYMHGIYWKEGKYIDIERSTFKYEKYEGLREAALKCNRAVKAVDDRASRDKGNFWKIGHSLRNKAHCRFWDTYCALVFDT